MNARLLALLTFLSIPALAEERRPLRETVPFDTFEVREEMVPMRDGIELYTLILTPKGESELRWFRSSESILWGFCGTCGSSMLYRADKEGHPESPKTDRMYVSVGSLVDAMDQEPKAHVSYEERQPWFHLDDGLAKHRGKTDETIDD